MIRLENEVLRMVVLEHMDETNGLSNRRSGFPTAVIESK
jgi:hypothetical protein